MAGIDVGLKGGVACAAVVVLAFPELEVVDQTTDRRQITFPYIPGLLTFREGPVILDALDRLERKPDLLIFDGQGIAHPYRFGIASHIGLLADLPSWNRRLNAAAIPRLSITAKPSAPFCERAPA